MSALAAYGRLLWRPRSAVNLFGMVCLAVFVCSISATLWALRGEPVSGAASRSGLLLVALPAAAGAAAVFPIQELLVCPFAHTLPALRARLGVALALAALGSAGLVVLVLGLAGWLVLPPSEALPLALACFGLGAAASDPALEPRRLAPAALLGLLLLMGSGGGLLQPLPLGPLANGVLFVGLAAGTLAAGLSRATSRRKAGLRPTELVGFMRLPRGGERWPEIEGSPSRARPPALSPDATRLGPWVRASFYERNGWSLGQWGWRLAFTVTLSIAALVAVAFQDGLSVAGSAHDAWLFVQHVLLEPGPAPLGPNVPPYHMVSCIAVVALLLAGMLLGTGLGAELLVPLTRREHAEVAWRATLAVHLVVAGGLLLGLVAAGELLLALRPAGVGEGRGLPFPNGPRSVATALLLAPLGQVGLRAWLWGPNRVSSPPTVGLKLGLVFVGAWIPAAWLASAWGRQVEVLPPWAWILTWAAAALGAQLLARYLLRRWYARRDLVP